MANLKVRVASAREWAAPELRKVHRDVSSELWAQSVGISHFRWSLAPNVGAECARNVV